MMKKIINNNKFLKIFLFIQPFLDVLAAVLIYNNVDNFVTSLIRLVFMGLMVLYLYFGEYENKKKTLIYVSTLIMTIIIHTLIMVFDKDMSVFMYEFKNTISTYYFVFLLISLGVFYKDNKISKKELMYLWIIYVLLTFIPNVLGIGFKSYSHSKTGMTGWFYSANVVGSILVILLPIILIEIKKLPKLLIVILGALVLYSVFSLGTKTPVLGLGIILFFNLLYYVYKLFKSKKKKSIVIIFSSLILLCGVSAYVIPKTSFYENLKIHYNFLKKNDVKIFSKEFLDHFVFSQRLSMEERTRHNYNKSHIQEKIFGIGYIENYSTDSVNLKIVEMDYFDIFYREGIIGFILFFIPVIYMIVMFFKNNSINFVSVNMFISILLIMLLALFQGHIFITPAISIFVALILNMGRSKLSE